jgi:Domain of unknown function (DUF4249)
MQANNSIDNISRVIPSSKPAKARINYFQAASVQFIVFITALLVICSLTSCEKVIDIKLDEAARKYVIEGNISNISTDAVEVKISQTKLFEEENSFTGISGATVTIQVNNGTIYTLPQVSPGIYRSTAFTGVPGNNYLLKVSLNGTDYTATSVMPVKLVNLDTLSVNDLAFGGTSTKTIQPSYLDPVGKGNSYRFIQYANGVQVKNIFVQDDAISDGLRITRPLVNQDGDLKSGDIVRVDMLCIDEAVYRYWYSLDQAATGQNQSATPANPVTNISGGALGYFSAHSVSTKTIALP